MGTAYPGVSHGHSATQHGHMCPCSVRCHHHPPLPRIPLHCQATPSTAVPPHSATRLQTGYRTYLKFLQNRKDSTWGGGGLRPDPKSMHVGQTVPQPLCEAFPAPGQRLHPHPQQLLCVVSIFLLLSLLNAPSRVMSPR